MITAKSQPPPLQAIETASSSRNGFTQVRVGAVASDPGAIGSASRSATVSTITLNASTAFQDNGVLASVAAVSLIVLGSVAMCSFSRRRRRTLYDPESQRAPQQQHPLSYYHPTGRSGHRTTLVLSPNTAHLAATVPKPMATAAISNRQSIDPIYIMANEPSPLAISLEAQRATMSPALRMRLSARLTLVASDHAVSAGALNPKPQATGDKKEPLDFDQAPGSSHTGDVEPAQVNDGEVSDKDDPYARMPASPSTIKSFCSPYIALDLDRSPLVPLATSLALESQVDLSDRDVSQAMLERYEHEGVAEAVEGDVTQGLPYMAVMVDHDDVLLPEKRLTAIPAPVHPLVLSASSMPSSISRSNTSSSAATITPLITGIRHFSQTDDHSNLVPNPYPSPVTDRLQPAALQIVPMDGQTNTSSSSSVSTLVCKSPVPTITSSSGTVTIPPSPNVSSSHSRPSNPPSSSSSTTTLSGTFSIPKDTRQSIQPPTVRSIGSGLRRPNRPRPLATPSTLVTSSPLPLASAFLQLPPGLILSPFPVPSPPLSFPSVPPSPPSSHQMYLTTAWSNLFTRLHADCTILVRKSLSLATTLGQSNAPLPPLTSPAAKKRRARLVCAASQELMMRATAVVQALAAGFAGPHARASVATSGGADPGCAAAAPGFNALANAMAGINLGVLAPPPPPPPSLLSSKSAGISKMQRDAVAEQVKARLEEDHLLFQGILAHPVLRPIVSALVDKNRMAVVSAPLVAWAAVALVQVQAAIPSAALVMAQADTHVAGAAAGSSDASGSVSPNVNGVYCVRRASGPGGITAVPGSRTSSQSQASALGSQGGASRSLDALLRVMYHQGGSMSVDGSVASLVSTTPNPGVGQVKYVGTLFPGILDQRTGQVLARCRVVTDVDRDGT